MVSSVWLFISPMNLIGSLSWYAKDSLLIPKKTRSLQNFISSFQKTDENTAANTKKPISDFLLSQNGSIKAGTGSEFRITSKRVQGFETD